MNRNQILTLETGNRIKPSLGKTDLSRRGHGAGRDPNGVDASVGVFVDFDVGLVLPRFDVSRRIEQVQHLLVVQLRTDYCRISQ